jgi:hypothetical protein
MVDWRDALNSGLGKVEDGWDAGKELVGEGIDKGTEVVGDVLDYAGAEGVADNVEDWGDEAASALGATPGER